MRIRSVCVTLGLVVLAGCGKSSTTAKVTTTTTTSTPPVTTPASYMSSTATAQSLDKSILTPGQIQTALHLSAPVVAFKAATSPQGPLNLDGTTAVFPSPVYKQALVSGGFGDGANRTFTTDGKVFYNVIAIDFKDSAGGAKFVTFAKSVATTVGGAKSTPLPDLKVGVLPGEVLRVPPSPAASPPNEIVVVAALYPNGVYYLVSISALPGATKDDDVVALLKAQDTAYQANKAALGLG